MRFQRLHTNGKALWSRVGACLFGVLAVSAAISLAPVAGEGLLQNTVPHLPPELNRIPDANQANDINSEEARKRNFDAINAIRTKEIAEDTVKLLILTRDFKAQMDKSGNDPLPARLVREAEVIELLAHDVQAKMKLTVGGG